MVGLEKQKINGFHPWSKKPKHAKKDHDPSHSIKDGTLDHASNPKKIGIISSGSLSNNILDHLKEEYPDLLHNSPFETYIENFNNLLLPNQLEKRTQEAQKQKASGEKQDQLSSDNDTQLVKDIEVCDQKTQTKSISDKDFEDNIISSSEEDDEYIFEPDSPDQLNADSNGSIDSSLSTSDITHSHEPHSEVYTNHKSEILNQSKNNLEHHPSLRERAHNILFELKKKLGFVKESPVEINDHAKIKQSQTNELEQEIISHPNTTEMEVNTSISKSDPISTENTSSEYESRIVGNLVTDSNDSLTRNQNQIQITDAKENAQETLFQTQPDNETYEVKPKSKILPKYSKSYQPETVNKDIHQRVNDLKYAMDGMDIIFIITCLDDVNDIENTNLLVDLADKMGILSIVIASLPRYFGRVDNVRSMNKILHNMRMVAGMVILLPYFGAFKFDLVPDLIKELMELITEPGLINVDIADIKMIVKGGNVGVITFGTGQKKTRAKDAFFKAIDSELLNVELAGVRKALINVTGGKDMTIGEVEGLAEQLRIRLKKGARLILGARVDPHVSNQLKIFIMLGVTPMQVMVNRYANE